jgi:putative aminopeptidase
MIKTFLRRINLISTLVVVFLSSTPGFGSQTTSDQTSLVNWLALAAPPGWEHLATDVILKTMPGWQRDQLGNLILKKGSGSPRRVIACGLDRGGFAVTEITDAGYLRIREVGAGRTHPLWVQFHEGQRIKVLTRTGSIPGVAIVKSTHLQRGRNPNAPVTTLDDIWLDLGVSSRAEVTRMGIQVLDPVVRDTSWSYGDYVSGPAAGVRVGCAGVASAATGRVTSGETIFLLTTLSSFGHDGLEAALRSLGRIDEFTLIDQSAESTDAVTRRKVDRPAYLPQSTGISSVTMIGARVRFAGSLVESVRMSDASALLEAVEKAASVDRSGSFVNLVSPAPKPQPHDLYSSTANLLKSLADVASVSGHEREVREAITAALPEWARQKATTDSEGNLIVEVGPDHDPVMFIAHQDEVGFEVTAIADDGTVSLRTRGGLFPSLWEGQPALLNIDRTDNSASQQIRGVFVPRATTTIKHPESVTAWFGLDAAKLKQAGVTVGHSVIADKHATRLGTTRFTARALDDRAGSTALILAARRIQPSLLKRKVILAWSVREETGLDGAIAMARRYGPSIKRVFSVDTFVSSDSPLETSRFAFTPLGQGAVIRGLDNAAVATPMEIDRILSVARAHRIPIQVGATNGGTDGSDFVRYGVLHVSLSWPGRYSHSPVEVLDLRDLLALERLIVALATTP